MKKFISALLTLTMLAAGTSCFAEWQQSPETQVPQAQQIDEIQAEVKRLEKEIAKIKKPSTLRCLLALATFLAAGVSVAIAMGHLAYVVDKEGAKKWCSESGLCKGSVELWGKLCSKIARAKGNTNFKDYATELLTWAQAKPH